MKPRDTIPAFDAFLAARGERLDAVLIGGAALGMLGIVSRETRDCDVLSPPLSAAIKEASREFAADCRRRGEPLDDEWLNNGPSSLGELLPTGWERRVEPLFTGAALHLSALGRADFLKTKLFAFCDRRTDLGDCLALAPTQAELDEALSWVQAQDANDLWPAHVVEMFAELSRRLGHGI